MKNLQTELQISYPTAKKKLDELLCKLDLEQDAANTDFMEEAKMADWKTNKDSAKASDIVKNKLKENGGRIWVAIKPEGDHHPHGLVGYEGLVADVIELYSRQNQEKKQNLTNS